MDTEKWDLQAKQRNVLCFLLSYSFVIICLAAFTYTLSGCVIIREINPG